MKRTRASLGKTTRPSPVGVLPRKRLFALLDEAAAPAIWVSGPPGSGKSTLAATWLEHAGIPHLWYQLDEGDADIATFFYYLSLAADAHGEREAEPLPLLAPEYQAGLALFTRRYFQQLFLRLQPPFALVFDNCQDVPTSSPLVEVIRMGLQELPPGGRAVFLSRTDPPPALARQRANRTLTLVGWEDLRLRREESAAIVARRRPGLPPDAVEALYARTQGWAAGLMLMLEHPSPPASIAQPIDLSTRKLVFDYLAGEIFEKSNERMQRFLLHTAYVPQMTADIAAELTGDEDAAQLVAELHRFNYFVSLRETAPQPHYQYHPLLRDFLQARAEETLPKERRHALQRASALQMERAGAIEDAIALYRECHDWAEMARMIELHAAAFLAQGRGETLARWVEELPPEVQAKRPWTVYWGAVSQAQLAPREGRIQYERAFELFRAQGDAVGIALAASGAMFAILYELDDFSLLDRWIAVLDEAAKGDARAPSAEAEARLACSMFIALSLRQPDRRDIRQWIERALAASTGVSDVNLRMFVGLLAALTLSWTGLFARAAALIQEMRRLSEGPGVTPFSRITLKNLEAMHAMLTADAAAGRRAVREGLELAEATGVRTWTFQLLLYGYGSALGAGDLAAAGQLAKRLEAQQAEAGRCNLCMFHLFQGWEALLRKDLMQALQKAKAALSRAIEIGCPLFEALCRLQLAEILVDCGDERKCVAHLQALRDIARRIDNAYLEFTCLVGFAQIALAHNRQRPGLNALRRALELGRQYGYAHYLGWRPAPMARVLAAAIANGIETDYAKSLIKRRRLVPEDGRPSSEEWPWTFRVQTFGGFRLMRDEEPLAASGKAQRRPLELLKVAIAHGGAQVSESRIIDALWPRVDGDSAHRSFTSALHRLRKLLGEDRAVLLHEGRVSLDQRYFWVDAWEFEDLAAREEAADAAQREKLVERMVALYRGPFMVEDVDAAWVLQARERMRGRLARAMSRVLRHWQENGDIERAREYEERIKQSVSDR